MGLVHTDVVFTFTCGHAPDIISLKISIVNCSLVVPYHSHNHCAIVVEEVVVTSLARYVNIGTRSHCRTANEPPAPPHRATLFTGLPSRPVWRIPPTENVSFTCCRKAVSSTATGNSPIMAAPTLFQLFCNG